MGACPSVSILVRIVCCRAGGSCQLLHQERNQAEGGVQEGEGEGPHQTSGHGLCHLPEWGYDGHVSTEQTEPVSTWTSARPCQLWLIGPASRCWLSLLFLHSILKDFNACQVQGCRCRQEPRSSQLSEVLHVHNWSVSYAPDPQNVRWYMTKKKSSDLNSCSLGKLIFLPAGNISHWVGSPGGSVASSSTVSFLSCSSSSPHLQ